MTGQDFWNTQHSKYSEEDWINNPTIFATESIEYLPVKGQLLDLGAGQGQDSRFFASKGFRVTSTDFSDNALNISRQKTPADLKTNVTFQNLDLSQVFPFKDSSFDIIYSHLALHYFNEQTTKQIFSEIHRCLKKGGILAILLNSTTDPEYGTHQKLEPDFFRFENGTTKRYFSTQSIQIFTSHFTPLLLDNLGETYKDRRIGVANLIRFIGRKDK